ncbi:hypothetical protein IW261DRAFT_1576679 [Armillaria novae-zelandiae]|uniref:Reverse transcriptase domain-containing protein n=1 Tax=Armillaria novae-zelandiae TaxID=153914 RepID=A0AA39N9K4_9AGAR|nr:hypothetical protein IW261DRAFT_1576679 [Armillaria novae-zelandiae]
MAITSPMIQALRAEQKHLGGAIYLIRNPETARVSQASLDYLQRFICHVPPSQSDEVEALLLARRKALAKELYNEHSREAYEQSRNSDRRKIGLALYSGSTKRLINTVTEFARLSLVVNKCGSDELISEPERVKEETRAYFTRLYNRPPPPDVPKPWITTRSVSNVCERVLNEPFDWPRQASITDYRSMLCKGNNKPSPGPDGWEKWCVKALNDRTLEIVVKLHNYMVSHSVFSGNVKDVWASAIYKRGLRTDLSNYQGLQISNFMANSPMTWLNFCLAPYISKIGIIPDTQVATQQGVQTRDLMSYLAGIETWANRHKKPVWCIKRDQMKGFDYLSPQGFHDVIRAYGLPSSIIDLDTAAQSMVSCSI